MSEEAYDDTLRKAQTADKGKIWEVLQQAIRHRKEDGSTQWQDGYPNLETVENDLLNGYGYVLEHQNEIAAYVAVIFDVEPAYEKLEGDWLSEAKYVVIHRVAVSDRFLGKGIATQLFKKVEDIAKAAGIFSIKVDTNFDNLPMLKILEKLSYTYCGQVYLRGGARRAFEKILK